MKNIAPSGEFGVIPLADWPRWLADPRCQLEVNRRCFGYAVRTDRWECTDSRRDWHMLYLVLEGEIPGRANGHPFRLERESLFWLNTDAPLDMTWPARLAFTEVWFRLTRDGQTLRLPDDLLVVEQAGELWPLFRQIEDELTLGGAMSSLKLRYLLAGLCIEIIRLQTGSQGARRLSPSQCRRLVQYVNEHIADRMELEELAKVTELSPDYFSRCFRQTFTLPPRDWVIRQRIREATRRLTSTNLTVYQVAEGLGYANVSQFSRQFHRHTGESPHRYRRRHGA